MTSASSSLSNDTVSLRPQSVGSEKAAFESNSRLAAIHANPQQLRPALNQRLRQSAANGAQFRCKLGILRIAGFGLNRGSSDRYGILSRLTAS